MKDIMSQRQYVYKRVPGFSVSERVTARSRPETRPANDDGHSLLPLLRALRQRSLEIVAWLA